MTRYLPWEKVSPLEASEVPRALPSILPWLPWEIIFPAVDNGSYTLPRSDLSYTYTPLRSDLYMYLSVPSPRGALGQWHMFKMAFMAVTWMPSSNLYHDSSIQRVRELDKPTT